MKEKLGYVLLMRIKNMTNVWFHCETNELERIKEINFSRYPSIHGSSKMTWEDPEEESNFIKWNIILLATPIGLYFIRTRGFIPMGCVPLKVLDFYLDTGEKHKT
ncbi:hypothetical protein AVEN_89489-1 [Araneus ventricosus]|uniref:Uncharacterized protein n=1 Tax=Araneus ventricosus TaxID=182803 RepID=A0A4Y2P351_ARAVE|nr:hypothetical protein AVEN_7458-1 [Araneus ventricosus]GBN44438.1 hypothetical protein AVEN_89489-1 [Araneus ventricosus]